MTILAFVLGLDPAFAATHHLARFLGITLLLPLTVKFEGGALSTHGGVAQDSLLIAGGQRLAAEAQYPDMLAPSPHRRSTSVQ